MLAEGKIQDVSIEEFKLLNVGIDLSNLDKNALSKKAQNIAESIVKELIDFGSDLQEEEQKLNISGINFGEQEVKKEEEIKNFLREIATELVKLLLDRDDKRVLCKGEYCLEIEIDTHGKNTRALSQEGQQNKYLADWEGLLVCTCWKNDKAVEQLRGSTRSKASSVFEPVSGHRD